MITFEHLSPNLRGCIGAVTFLIFLVGVLLFVRLLQQKRRLMACCVIAAAVFLYLTEQLISLYQNYDTLILLSPLAQRLAMFYVSLPACLILAVLAAAAIGEGWLYFDIREKEGHMINSASVKEAVDSLPSGILCYLPSGRIILGNLAMEEFCLRCYGQLPASGNDLPAHLERKELSKGCSVRMIGSQRTVSFPDESTYEVIYEDGKYGKDPFRMILVHDITRETEKVKQLWEAGEAQKKINRQLLEQNDRIVALTASEETLRAKVRIHNELGALLLQIRRNLSGEMEPEEKKRLRKRLTGSISYLKFEKEEESEDECGQILSAAAKLGVTVQLTGELPRDEQARHIIACALHECLTNTLRHAHGDHLYVSIKDTEISGENDGTPGLFAVFTNNGDPPAGTVTEKGGLKSLRRLTEQARGRMLIQNSPEFKLTIEL